MAQERGEPSPDIPEARGNPMKLHSALESHKGKQSGCPGEWASDLECAVCLQTCIHPVRLPCNHIFCYLCVKGAANLSKRCALCRQEIPVDYLNNPALVLRDDVAKADKALCEDGLQWFYEGRNGWWQYDERTSSELEEKFKQGIKTFELLIAGFLYVIDFENMIQIRRNDPTRRRRVKRDRSTIQKKGVAGLKIPLPGAEGNTREGCDGEESGEPAAVPANNNDTNRRPATSAPAPGPPNGVLAPEPPADTPPSPSDDNSSSSSSTPSSQEELAMHLAAVSLNSQRRPPPRRRRRADIPTYHRMRLLESPESSDSGWDG